MDRSFLSVSAAIKLSASLVAGMLLTVSIGLAAVVAATSIEKRDENGDGRIDRVAHYDDDGFLTRLEVDTNGDGRMDAIQVYHQDEPIKIEKDADHDGHFELREYFKDRRRSRSEQVDRQNRIVRRALLDAHGQPEKISQDTTGDGVLDSVYFYDQGQIVRMVKDADLNGRPEVSVQFEASQPVLEKKDANQDGRVDRITHFHQGRAHKREDDTNDDGKMDQMHYFDAVGQTIRIEIDTTHNGQIDRIQHFKEDALTLTETDLDGDGYRETWLSVAHGRIVSRGEDRNQDGRVDVTTHYGVDGKVSQTQIDSDGNGRVDRWQFYRNDSLQRMECDENGDFKVDLKIYYRDGEKYLSEKDDNGNGYFETIERVDPGQGTVIVEKDLDENMIFEHRAFFRQAILRKQTLDSDQDGILDRIEHFDEKARPTRVEASPTREGRMTLIWHYDENGLPRRAEKDADHDGSVDAWYYFDRGRLDRVEEDTNRDGRPDLWEAYDTKEQLQWRKRDLDHDGLPDLEDRVSGEPASKKNSSPF